MEKEIKEELTPSELCEDEIMKLEADVAEEGQDEKEEGIKLPSTMSKRQQKQFMRMLTGKKPVRANQTKANSDKPKKKKDKRKNAKAARRKNRK